jgi:DNA-binding HxlR family transcriptional regulator
VLAACPWSGPHRYRPLRKWTRLTPQAFETALQELAAAGLVERQHGDIFWVTGPGEHWTRARFA